MAKRCCNSRANHELRENAAQPGYEDPYETQVSLGREYTFCGTEISAGSERGRTSCARLGSLMMAKERSNGQMILMILDMIVLGI